MIKIEIKVFMSFYKTYEYLNFLGNVYSLKPTDTSGKNESYVFFISLFLNNTPNTMGMYLE